MGGGHRGGAIGIDHQYGGDQHDQPVDYLSRHSFADRPGWVLQNLLTLARPMIAAASERTESRGAPSRRDFLDRDDAPWLLHAIAPPRGEW